MEEEEIGDDDEINDDGELDCAKLVAPAGRNVGP